MDRHRSPLEVVQLVGKVFARLQVDGLTNQKGKLMGVLAWSRHTHCSLGEEGNISSIEIGIQDTFGTLRNAIVQWSLR